MKRPVVIILLVLALLFVLTGIGAVLFFSIRQADIFTGRLPADATVDESKSLKVDVEEPLTVNVRNDAGNVTILGGDVTAVEVDVVKTAHARTEAEAEEEAKNIKYDIDQAGNTLTITYDVPRITTNMPNVSVIDANQDTVDFIVTVPSKATVDIDARLAEVSVSDIEGDVSIANDFGEVTVRNIEGGLNVGTQSGKVDASSIRAGSESIELSSGFGSVSLEKGSGKDVTLNSKSGGLEMSDVRASGDVEMTTDFGDISFDDGSANVLSVQTNSGKISLNALTLRGTVTAKSEFGEISLEQVKATSYDLQTNSGSVTADGVGGNVKAHSGFGSVTVQNAHSVTLDLSTRSGPVVFEGSLGEGPHSVRSEFGEIRLTLPADSALNVDLQTNFGSIQSEIPITVVLSGDLEKGRQTGTINDGGEQLTVETGSGSISIQSGK